MYRDGRIDDDDWYDDEDSSDDVEEPTWRGIFKGVGYIYLSVFLMFAWGSHPGQIILGKIFTQVDFLLAIVPGAWET